MIYKKLDNKNFFFLLLTYYTTSKFKRLYRNKEKTMYKYSSKNVGIKSSNKVLSKGIKYVNDAWLILYLNNRQFNHYFSF